MLSFYIFLFSTNQDLKSLQQNQDQREEEGQVSMRKKMRMLLLLLLITIYHLIKMLAVP
jgi:hypothetical protein